MTVSSVGAPTKLFAAILALVGIAYLYGGALLAWLGGSPYFLITGVAIAASGVLIWRGNAWGGWIYATMLAATMCWAVVEAGVDFWGLLPRLFGPCLFGLYLLTPWYRRSLRNGWRSRGAARGLAGAFILSIAGLFAWGNHAGDPAQTTAGYALPERLGTYRTSAAEDWPHYGNDQHGTRFSPLTQIAPANVDKLEVAWTYRTGEYPPKDGGPTRRFQATPLKVDGALFFCTAESTVIALDAATGRQRWRSAVPLDLAKVMSSAPCRGVAFYAVPAARQDRTVRNAAGGPLCATRIIAPSVDARLRALDARTGEVCTGFGNGGHVDLKAGLGPVISDYYYASSAPQILRGRVVLGGRMMDGRSAGEPTGVIRAYDATTGAFSWAFDMGRVDDHAMPGPNREFTRGTPNSWAPISADDALGLVYLPIGNTVPDYWGGHRRDFDERFSSSVIALDADSGALRWSYQTTHHDLWDMDVPSQPSLVDLVVGGRTVPALVQLTKRGQTFVLDRRTGRPIFAVKEQPAPRGGVEAARVSPTQPHSIELPDFSGANPKTPGGIDETDMWGITPFDLMWCRIRFHQARYDGPLTPPGLDSVLLFPGAFGGANWQSGSFDPERKIMIVNWNRFPFYMRLLPRGDATAATARAADGMPQSFGEKGTPYAAKIDAFLSPLGAPCIAPPYQMVSAVDLTNKRLLWSKRAGTAEDTGLRFGGTPIPSRLPIPLGPPGIGGAVTTRSGLIFIAASGEQSLRAMDLASGNILWKARLPAGGNATPMTYQQDGRQYVVIAAGGHNQLNTTPGDYVIAYALPKTR